MENLFVQDNELVELIKASRKVGPVNRNKEELFRYEDEDGNDFDVKAEHINKYIQECHRFRIIQQSNLEPGLLHGKWQQDWH